MSTLVLDVEEVAAKLRFSRALAQLHQEEIALEQAGKNLAALGLRKARFDVIMNQGYKPPCPTLKMFQGPGERQVDLTIFAPTLRLYRRAFHCLGLPVPPLPNLRQMGLVPYRPKSAAA